MPTLYLCKEAMRKLEISLFASRVVGNEKARLLAPILCFAQRSLILYNTFNANEK